MKAAATQFPLPEGMNLPLTLRHYRVFISYCSPSKKKAGLTFWKWKTW